MYLLLLRYCFELFEKMEMLMSKNFVYYFLKVIVICFLFIFLVKLIWYFGIKYKGVRIKRRMFKNIIFKH